jgi:mRNA-degrading endonuclease RelE of RelBE toxin-antitoxin system
MDEFGVGGVFSDYANYLTKVSETIFCSFSPHFETVIVLTENYRYRYSSFHIFAKVVFNKSTVTVGHFKKSSLLF